MNNKEKRFLYHNLKNQDVFSKHKDKIAKGESKIKRFIIPYIHI